MKNDTIEKVTREQCTGCGACREICPKQAIAFRDDSEGFPTPYIQEDKCIDCGLCAKVCPALNPPKMNPIGDTYAAQILDRDALKDSTSGGVFTVFAREIFRRGGVVYGCVWDEEYNAVVRRADSEEQMLPMRGSKYVWSYAGDTFPEVKKDLEAGLEVLFSGLPCQVAGLKNYLRRDYDNLYLLTFFCGGSPSPYAFHEYLKTITGDVSIDALDFKFRDKEKFGVGVNISYQGKSGRVHQAYWKNPYFFSYHTKVLHRMPCYTCRYRNAPRVEDITVGDYWGIRNYHDEFDIRAGVSTLLLNNEKAKRLFEAIKDQLQISETRIEDIARHNNLNLKEKERVYHPPKFRDAFFSTVKSQGWTAAEKRYLFNKQRMKLWFKSTKLGSAAAKMRNKLKK